MKKIIVLCIAGLMMIAAGCSVPTPTPTVAPTVAPTTAPASTEATTAALTTEATQSPAGEPTVEPTASPAEIAPLNLQDLSIVVEGEFFALQTDVGDFLEALGDGFDVNDVKGRYTGDTEKQYVYSDVTLTAFPADDTEVVYCIEFSGDACDSARSVHAGSTADEVKAAYGEGYYEEDGAMIYTFDGKKADDQKSSLTFKIKDGVVTSTIIYNAGEIFE